MYRLFFKSAAVLVMATAIATGQPAEAQGRHFSASYWNDNFAYQKYIRDLVTPGQDDGVTASISLQYGTRSGRRLSGIDIYFSIITNKADGYRTDLATLRWLRGRLIPRGSWMAGIGLTAIGNFGGASLQNGYHELIDSAPVDLPYTATKGAGVSLYGRGRLNLYSVGRLSLNGYAASALRSGAGASYVRGGIFTNIPFLEGGEQISGQLQFYTGTFQYIHTRRLFEPLFKNGIMFGGLLSVNIIKKYTISLWMTENQYGRSDPHYGITVSRVQGWLRFGSLQDILFP